MAKAIEKGLRSENVEAVRKRVDESNVDALSAFDGVVIGSPTYFGT